MLDGPQRDIALARCGLYYVGEFEHYACYTSGVQRYLAEPITVHLGDDRISEQRLSDTLVAQGIPLAIVEDALLEIRQNPPSPPR